MIMRMITDPGMSDNLARYLAAHPIADEQWQWLIDHGIDSRDATSFLAGVEAGLRMGREIVWGRKRGVDAGDEQAREGSGVSP